MTAVLTRIQVRDDTTANWEADNPILAEAEPGVEITVDDRRLFKVGNGVDVWTDLPYIGATDSGALRQDQNLNDLLDKAAARLALGVGTAGTHPETDFATPTALASAVASEASRATTAETARILLSTLGQPGGPAQLGFDGKLPAIVLPPAAINDFFDCASEVAMLAEPAQKGDVAIRSDFTPAKWFWLTSNSPGVLTDWREIAAPGGVSTVNYGGGPQAGAVVIPVDPGAGTAGLRTLGPGAQQAAQGSALAAEITTARANEAALETPAGAQAKADAAQAFARQRGNHTGSQLAASISDLVATVVALRLDQFAAPTAPVSFGGQRGTNFLDPVGAQDAATRAWTLTQIANLVASSPAALDTLNELAVALGNDPNFSTTILAAIAAKVISGAYGPGWNNDTTHAPSRDDVYDKIEALSGAYAPLAARDTAANLVAANAVYAAGRRVDISDASPAAYKIGDGVTAFNSLPWFRAKSDPVQNNYDAVVLSAGSATTATPLSNLGSVAFTVGSIPWEVMLYLPVWLGNTVGDTFQFHLADNTGSLTVFDGGVGAVTKNTVSVVSKALGAVIIRGQLSTPGSYIIRPEYLRTVGTGTMSCGATSVRSFLRAMPQAA